jgi:hypothetical protein
MSTQAMTPIPDTPRIATVVLTAWSILGIVVATFLGLQDWADAEATDIARR